MTGVASRREPGRGMSYRRGSVIVVGLVARHARSTGQTVIVVDMAVGAGSGRHRV